MEGKKEEVVNGSYLECLGLEMCRQWGTYVMSCINVQMEVSRFGWAMVSVDGSQVVLNFKSKEDIKHLYDMVINSIKDEQL